MKKLFLIKKSQFTFCSILFVTILISNMVYGQPDETVSHLDKNDHSVLLSLGEKVVGKAMPAMPIKNTAKLMPLHEGTWLYRITAGGRKGTTQKASISQTHRRGSNGLWSRSIHEDCTEFFSVETDGTIHLVSEMDLKQNVITHYSPAIPFMFDGMKPGQAKEVETDVKVYDLHDTTFLKYHGKLKVTHT